MVNVPPSDSSFNTKDETNILNVEVTYMCIVKKVVFLMRDFNTKICNKEDFVEV